MRGTLPPLEGVAHNSWSVVKVQSGPPDLGSCATPVYTAKGTPWAVCTRNNSSTPPEVSYH
jgi:hypothetical protein